MGTTCGNSSTAYYVHGAGGSSGELSYYSTCTTIVAKWASNLDKDRFLAIFVAFASCVAADKLHAPTASPEGFFVNMIRHLDKLQQDRSLVLLAEMCRHWIYWLAWNDSRIW